MGAEYTKRKMIRSDARSFGREFVAPSLMYVCSTLRSALLLTPKISSRLETEGRWLSGRRLFLLARRLRYNLG